VLLWLLVLVLLGLLGLLGLLVLLTLVTPVLLLIRPFLLLLLVCAAAFFVGSFCCVVSAVCCLSGMCALSRVGRTTGLLVGCQRVPGRRCASGIFAGSRLLSATASVRHRQQLYVVRVPVSVLL
jgi:hypothetical protein